MSCFWQGLLDGLNKKDFEQFGLKKKPNVTKFVKLLKRNNRLTDNVTCNGEELSKQLLQENMKSIDEYKADNVGQGYLCASFDPFLLLVCELFKVNIVHYYGKSRIIYLYKDINRTIEYQSNDKHFWFE